MKCDTSEKEQVAAASVFYFIILILLIFFLFSSFFGKVVRSSSFIFKEFLVLAVISVNNNEVRSPTKYSTRLHFIVIAATKERMYVCGCAREEDFHYNTTTTTTKPAADRGYN